MSKYDKIKQLNDVQAISEIEQYKTAKEGMDELVSDTTRTAEIYQNAEKYLADIDKQFSVATGLTKTDVAIGGYIVTMQRLISDTKFISGVKKEFLEKEWHKLVVGEDYDFISEVKTNEQ